MSFTAYQVEDVERAMEAHELRKGQLNGLHPNSKGYVIFVSVALLALSCFGLTHLNYHERLIESATSLGSKIRTLTPEQLEAAAKEAEIRRIAGLAHAYLPAANYEDPCDAVRIDCCTDPKFPVLGGLDVVRYRLTGDLVFGNPKYTVQVSGLTQTYTFWFSEKSLIPLFEANREAYLPKWGGFNVDDFCVEGGNVETLVGYTVDLSEPQDIDRHLAFGHIPNELTVECDNAFNSLYGLPINGVFNTRCVSMSNFQKPVSGMLPQMPLTAIPVKMSDLYGVPPRYPLIRPRSDVAPEREHAFELSGTAVMDTFETGDLVAVQTNSHIQTVESVVLTNSQENLPEISSQYISVSAGSSASIDEGGLLKSQDARAEIGDTIVFTKTVFPFVESRDTNGQVNRATEFVPSPGSEQADELATPEPALSLDKLPDQNESLESVEQYITDQNAQIIPQNWHTSEKPLGEKALLKRGTVAAGELSPGLGKQLAHDEEILTEEIDKLEAAVSQLSSSEINSSLDGSSADFGAETESLDELREKQEEIKIPSAVTEGTFPVEELLDENYHPESNQISEEQTLQMNISPNASNLQQQPSGSEQQDVQSNRNPQNWHTSEKPLGEKALLKRGVVTVDELSPGITKQLVQDESVVDVNNYQ